MKKNQLIRKNYKNIYIINFCIQKYLLNISTFFHENLENYYSFKSLIDNKEQ